MTDAKEGTAIERIEGGGITPYGRRAEIRELVQRLKIMAPGGMNLTDNEALALAQYAFSMGLNPLVGECWFIKTKDGRPLGMMPGIAGYRRKAQEQSAAKGSDYWLEYEEITSPEERSRLAIPDGALAVKSRLYEMHKTQAYAASAKQLSDAGAPWSEIRGIIGDKPYVEGISFIKKAEMAQLEKGKLQMPHIQRARKRAEAHALKQAYHLPFGFETPTDELPLLMDDYVIEGSFVTEQSPEEIEVGATEAREELFEQEEAAVEQDSAVEPEGYWPDEWVDWFRSPEMNIMPPDAHPKHIESLMKLSPFMLSEDKQTILYGERRVTKLMLKVWLKEYRILRDGDMSSKDAANGATHSWEVKYGDSRAAD
jgi:hypothetical protein